MIFMKNMKSTEILHINPATHLKQIKLFMPGDRSGKGVMKGNFSFKYVRIKWISLRPVNFFSRN